MAMDPKLKEFLGTLVWDDPDNHPAASLIDEVTQWLMDNRPGRTYEYCADTADRIVLDRLR